MSLGGVSLISVDAILAAKWLPRINRNLVQSKRINHGEFRWWILHREKIAPACRTGTRQPFEMSRSHALKKGNAVWSALKENTKPRVLKGAVSQHTHDSGTCLGIQNASESLVFDTAALAQLSCRTRCRRLRGIMFHIDCALSRTVVGSSQATQR